MRPDREMRLSQRFSAVQVLTPKIEYNPQNPAMLVAINTIANTSIMIPIVPVKADEKNKYSSMTAMISLIILSEVPMFFFILLMGYKDPCWHKQFPRILVNARYKAQACIISASSILFNCVLFPVTATDTQLNRNAFECSVTAEHATVLFKRAKQSTASETCIEPEASVFRNVFLVRKSAFGAADR
jgi:hypothetical protein